MWTRVKGLSKYAVRLNGRPVIAIVIIIIIIGILRKSLYYLLYTSFGGGGSHNKDFSCSIAVAGQLLQGLFQNIISRPAARSNQARALKHPKALTPKA